MTNTPTFPTTLHNDTAEIVRDYFLPIANVDTVLVVNSCARGLAVPESDLDFSAVAGVHPRPGPCSYYRVQGTRPSRDRRSGGERLHRNRLP